MGAFLPSENYGVNLVRNTPDGALHAQRHYDLCKAINLLGVGIVLEEMVKTKHISPLVAEAFETQARGLLATMLAENSRSFIGSPEQSTANKIRRFGIEAKLHETPDENG